ncbi:MAG: HD domain-containing phosphohydrolase [Fimbriimonadaceae bacterium]
MLPSRLRHHLLALDAHSPGEGGHAERVAVFATAIANQLSFEPEEQLLMRFAAALHDVGKLCVKARILKSVKKPTGEDVLALRLHVGLAQRVLGEELSPLQLDWIAAHHERWDGKGYPAQLRGEEIPLGSRIISVAEAFDSMTAPSAYRTPLSEESALEEIRRCAGIQFDPAVTAAFFEVQPLIQPVFRN